MIYTFSIFSLNTNSKELLANNKVLPLTSQHYELLLKFVKSPGVVYSKDELIDTVWKGRVVTGNTVDQSISKLRKILNTEIKDTYIKTAYGKGFIFEPKVELIEEEISRTSRKSNKILIPSILIGFIFIFLMVYYSTRTNNIAVHANQKPLLILMSSANATQDSWLEQSSVKYMDQILEYANISNLKHFENKPEHQDREQFINNQWEISPELQVVTTHVFQNDNLYTVELNLTNKLQNKQTQSFSNQNLALAIKSASEWIAKKMDSQTNLDKINSLIPQNSHVVELYMQGLSSLAKGEIDKAGHFLQICMDESPNFYLARLEMAKVYSAQGNQNKSLAILDTLTKTEIYPQIEIEVATIRGDIYDTQGKYVDAKELYLSVLNKFKGQSIPQINDIRYNLSYTHTMLNEYESALDQLKTIELETSQTEGFELLAHVYQKQASIYQKLGYMLEAKNSADKALELFAKLQDVLGEAKVYVALARISTHQSKYKESAQYLQRALNINKSLKYKLGTGATLNELIYVLMVQGKFNQALDFNQEMQKIALEIDYNAMLQISKQYDMDIHRQKKQWDKSAMYLKEHLELAQASNSKSALLKNKLLSIDLTLDQEKTDGVKHLIDNVQSHIDESGEIRLQPRINKHLARYYFLIDHPEKGLALLLSSKELAQNTEDGETLIEINNMMAEYYLKIDEPQKALAILEDSVEYEPLAYPYLLIKSKANHAIGNTLKAMDYANECKNLSNEWWTLEDEIYLESLEEKV